MISKKVNNIFINGKKETITNVNHDISLLEWLRNNLKMTGTKEGCAEGDCGACSVIINEENYSNLKPVNSCLVRIGQVIGKNIVTIEGLGNDKDPHPLQVAFSKTRAFVCRKPCIVRFVRLRFLYFFVRFANLLAKLVFFFVFGCPFCCPVPISDSKWVSLGRPGPSFWTHF